jgi:hypothetical protein
LIVTGSIQHTNDEYDLKVSLSFNRLQVKLIGFLKKCPLNSVNPHGMPNRWITTRQRNDKRKMSHGVNWTKLALSTENEENPQETGRV